MHLPFKSYRRTGGDTNQIKSTIIVAFIFTFAVDFTGVISSYGFELLSGIFLLQPEGLSSAFFVGKFYW